MHTVRGECSIVVTIYRLHGSPLGKELYIYKKKEKMQIFSDLFLTKQ